MRKFLFLLLVCFAFTNLFAQSIPSPKQFLGYEVGEKFTPHFKLVQYYQALLKAAPAQIKMEEYGSTNEGRPLMLLYLSSPENLNNLENIRRNNLKLAGMPAGERSDADVNSPAIVWLSYNVHGNEASSSEACLLTVYDLLTNAKSMGYLKNTVVIIDPCINPDGRDRYVNWYNSVSGKVMNVDAQSREHSEPWPGGRTNHYNFDLNRDWAWQTQLETKQRLKKYQQWMPQIHVDYHEQGFNEPYYFAPAAEPFHEVITPWQRNFQTIIGRNNAKYFDANGWLYFTKERFDLFYPSYGDTWPTYNGAIGMTFEQGGIRAGLGIINEDGDTLTLRDRALHHFTTGISTIEMASANSKALVENFKKYFSDARANGVGAYKSFVVKAKGNERKLPQLYQLLNQNNIAFAMATPRSAATGFNYFTGKDESFSIEKGDIIISTQQSGGNMAKVLFEPASKITDSATYDITAWSIPYAYGLPTYGVKDAVGSEPNRAVTLPAQVSALSNAAAYGYVVPWQSMDDARVLAELMTAGIKVRVPEKPFEVNGKKYAAGSLIIIKTSNKSVTNFDAKVEAIVAKNGGMADAVLSGFVDMGSDFGSPDVRVLTAPKVALFTGEQSGGNAAGEIWFYFENDLKYPLSLINVTDAGRLDLKKYDVIIVPDGNYRTLLSKDGDLKKWVDQGGKLIALENALSQISNADWGPDGKKNSDEKSTDTYASLRRYENREKDFLTTNNPGSIFKVNLDNSHPMAWGYPDYYYTLKGDDNVYEFMKNGWNVGVLKKDTPVAGFVGAKAKGQFKDGVLFGQMPVGRGSVVFFADDVLFRNFWQNGKLMFANAVFMVR